MSLKTIRILSTVAMILYAVSLAIETVFMVVELTMGWPLALLSTSIYSGLVLFAISLILMLMVRRLKSDRASRKCVIVLTSVLGGWHLLSFALSFLFSRLFNVYFDLGTISAYHLSVFNIINNISSIILNNPALLMMMLAMGGFCNRAGRLNAVKESAIEPKIDYQEHKAFTEIETLTENDD